MSQEPDMSFADGVRVKEELEIGPTVLQLRSICDPIIKVEREEDFDTSNRTSCSIKTENDVDDESEPPDSELLTAGCAPESLSVKESLEHETGSQEQKDIKPVFTEMSLKWEVGEGQSCSEVQSRVLATESRAGDSLTRAVRRGPVGRHHTTVLQGQKLIHTTKTPYECEICNAKFKRAGAMKSHKLTHTGEKPFECEICYARFKHAGDLNRHTLTHTGEKPFQCAICNAKFTRAGHLKTHKLTHTDEKPFECEICKARFKWAGNLKTHKLTHTGENPFKCEICKARFKRAGNLKTHKLTHTGEKPFECEICNAKFTRAGTLKTHKLTHTGEKPFECEICNAKFTQAGNLKTHKLIHTGILAKIALDVNYVTPNLHKQVL